MARRITPALPVTKLRPPISEAYFLPRPRLLNDLGRTKLRKLALLIAPTGSGKTTLMADACRRLAAEGLATAWLTLDRCESNPRYFLDHLTVAVRQVLPTVGQEALAMLQGYNTPVETVMSSLINDLTEAETPLALFLDDFQEADVPEVANLVAYLLRYLPANVHIVLASQRNFPLSLSWAHAREWAIELGWEDLRLNPEEIRSYLRDARALEISDGLVADLAAQTEGWVCALQLAAIALGQHRTDLPWKSTGPDFADILLDDVFNRQTADMQRFLLDTSILDRLSPSLCDAVTQTSQSRARLEELEKAQFLVQRLDMEGGWLRYHNLFSTFLRKRLRSQEPERARRLHKHAGDWYAGHELINEALNHWLAAEAVEEASRLLTTHGQNLLRNAEIPDLNAWLGRLPAAVIAASPALSTLKAWCALHYGRPLTIRAALEEAQHAQEIGGKIPSPAQACEWIILRAMSGVSRYDWLDTSGVHMGLPHAFTEEQPVQRAFAHVIVGYARRNAGDLPGAWAAYREAAELADSDGILSVNYIARYGLGLVDILRARPDRALEGVQSWFGDAARRAYWRTGGAAFLRALQAQCFMEQGRAAEAYSAINESTTLLENSGTSSFRGVALVLRARLRAAEGQTDDALADLALAREISAPHRIARALFRADLCEAWIRLREGEPAQAERLMARARQVLDESGQTSGENVEAWQILRCSWLLACRRHNEAQELAHAAENGARAGGRVRNVIEFLLWQAVAVQSRPGGIALGATCLEEARKLAQPGGVVLPFRQLASALVPLAVTEEPDTASESPAPTPTGLHQREAQILRLLEQGLRNKDIAARLFLSEETVKWYLKRLYDNFEVGNRVQLLACVRKLGLLMDVG